MSPAGRPVVSSNIIASTGTRPATRSRGPWCPLVHTAASIFRPEGAQSGARLLLDDGREAASTRARTLADTAALRSTSDAGAPDASAVTVAAVAAAPGAAASEAGAPGGAPAGKPLKAFLPLLPSCRRALAALSVAALGSVAPLV